MSKDHKLKKSQQNLLNVVIRLDKVKTIGTQAALNIY